MLISGLQTIFKPLFGTFEREELKKFLRMGITFTFIIASYWTLRTLKNSLFGGLVGQDWLPIAKTVSLVILVPLIMFYTKLLDKYSRKKTFYVISTAYAIITAMFALLFLVPQIGLASKSIIAARTGLSFWGTQILGYAWYVFVESYGSLVIALFWAIASDTTMPDSAKKGFSLVVAIGQIGGIIFPTLFPYLPSLFNITGGYASASAVGLCVITIIASILGLRSFLENTPKELLVAFHGKNEKAEEAEQEPGFLEGLKLLVTHKYLLSIFGILSFFEIIITIFDLHFQTLAGAAYVNDQHGLTVFLGHYGSYVNLVALACLLLGVGNITRIIGVGAALVLMPIIYAGAIFGFITLNSLTFLFWLMVSSKAINYALNGPAIKQLYIPTTHDVKFKAQAWIETFGSRASKEGGSVFNMLLVPLKKRMGDVAGTAQHVVYSSYLGFTLVTVWFFLAIYLGRTYKKAIDEKRVVC